MARGFLNIETGSVLKRPLLIIVGLTGTGKTTTVNALCQAGLSILLLPNRRELTDRFIIQYLQQLDGEPVAPVTDRAARFTYTRRYRELNQGGMAEALFQYSQSSELFLGSSKQLLLFDGLRGENEVSHAAKLFQEARFLFLHAPDFVRVERLANRQDKFDAVVVTGNGNTAVSQQLAANILTENELNQLLALITVGEISAEELQAKLTIVRAERQNYDPKATLAALQRLAPERLILADTTKFTPDEIACQVAAIMGQKEMGQ